MQKTDRIKKKLKKNNNRVGIFLTQSISQKEIPKFLYPSQRVMQQAMSAKWFNGNGSGNPIDIFTILGVTVNLKRS